MTGDRLAIVLALAGCAVLAVPPAMGMAPRRRSARRLPPAARRMLVAGLGAGSAAAILSMPAMICVAAAAGAALLVRRSTAARRPLDVAGMRDLAGVLDLVATCLRSGLTVSGAITAVLRATASGDADDADPAPKNGEGAGPRAALAEVAALLALGADPESAWRPAVSRRELAGLASAAQRSAVGGVRLADAVCEAAAELRRNCRVAGERGAARAGVAMTAPLALCFLPAFVCLGLAPVIVGMVSSLHIW